MAVKPPGPVQEKVTSGVVELPWIVAVGWLQVSMAPEVLIEGEGGTVAVTEAVEVQPFTGLVTVNSLVPKLTAPGFCWVEINPLGPVH